MPSVSVCQSCSPPRLFGANAAPNSAPRRCSASDSDGFSFSTLYYSHVPSPTQIHTTSDMNSAVCVWSCREQVCWWAAVTDSSSSSTCICNDHWIYDSSTESCVDADKAFVFLMCSTNNGVFSEWQVELAFLIRVCILMNLSAVGVFSVGVKHLLNATETKSQREEDKNKPCVWLNKNINSQFSI